MLRKHIRAVVGPPPLTHLGNGVCIAAVEMMLICGGRAIFVRTATIAALLSQQLVGFEKTGTPAD
jgi:hypothetical protein